MRPCVFLGPSLPVAAAREILDADYLPPAAHGDIIRATLRRPKPRAIVLIDGVFRHRPAVRHKEILWALSEGIHVFGAASMGALRAAELEAFGMVGIGAVFAAFRDGTLEDDDEVAVDHGPAELGYPAINEAMVDIRATLAAARAQGVIDAEIETRLVAVAKRQFYVERSYPGLIAAARKDGIESLDRLERWIPAGRISAKRDDTVSALGGLKTFFSENPPPFAAAFRLEQSEMWEADFHAATEHAAG